LLRTAASPSASSWNQYLLVRAFVKCQRFGEPILPGIDISDVDFQPSQPASIPLAPKDCTRALPGSEGLIVAAQQ